MVPKLQEEYSEAPFCLKKILLPKALIMALLEFPRLKRY